MVYPVKIEKCMVGPGKPCFIIAEAGVNHNGDMNLAHKLIDEAIKAGANAIKFQSYITEDLLTQNAPKAKYQVEATGNNCSQYEMLKALELTISQQRELKSHCEELDLIYLCTPYEEKSADLLEEIGVKAYKISSTDTSNIPFLRHIAKKNIPVILSTGMSTLGEVEEAVNELSFFELSKKIILLQCTTEYPAPMNEINLRVIHTMERAFDLPVGFSDHTKGILASQWAVAIGACIIEKHFTLDKSLAGPDHRASIEPEEFTMMVTAIRELEAAFGNGIKKVMPSEIPNKSRMQKSLVTKREIYAGETILLSDLISKRPGTGLCPKWADRIVGKKASKTIQKGNLIGIESVCWSED